ncbi:hypothetical protein AgCh_005471 [Apium graveolens]
MKNQIKIKFLGLTQGNLTVTDYESNFTELARRPQSGNGGQGSHFPNSNQQRYNRPPMSDYKFCGRRFFRICKANVLYFKYNQKGHYANECQNQTSAQKSRTVCFKYGKMGHISRDYQATYPVANVARIEGPPAKNQPKARMFNLTVNDVVQSSDMVACTLPVNSIDAKVLIDSGATRVKASSEPNAQQRLYST